MADGSPPPKAVGIMRVCSDQGSGPGPLTDKIGNFSWNTEQGANKTAAAMIPLDKGRIFAEMYLHQSVANYNLKNLAAAEANATEALNPKAKLPAVRAEYVLGRILEAKGDVAGAKEHMARYLTLAPSAQDSGQIKAHIDQIGQPDAPEPELEILTR